MTAVGLILSLRSIANRVDFRRAVRFDEQCRYIAFTRFQQSGMQASCFCQRVGWNRKKLRGVLFGRGKMRIEDLSDILFALGLEMEIGMMPDVKKILFR